MSYFPPISVKQVINKIEYNQYLLPAIQREFVWSEKKIELLFDSLMRNYPIGSLLMWKVQGENKTKHRFYTVLKKYREKYNTHCKEINTSTIADFEAILDGQQRITALYLGLKGSYATKRKNYTFKDNEHSIPTKKMYLCLSPDSVKEDENEDGRVYDFRFLTIDEHEHSTHLWFEVSQILALTGTFELSQYLRDQGWDSNRYITNTLTKLFDAIHVKTPINYYLEMEQSYEKALNIFIRINSGGEKLSYSDLIMSTIISSWNTNSTSARDEFKNLINEVWSSTDISIDKDLIIRTYLLIFSEDIKFRVTNFSAENAKEFEKEWKGIRSAIVETFDLLQTFGYTERTITSKNAVLPIIHYLHISGRRKKFSRKVSYKEDREIIKRWFHTVLLKRTFGGQSDSVLKTIRDTVKREVTNGTLIFPANAIAQKLAGTRKSLSIDSETIDNLLATKYEDRYAFSILALLYPHLDYKNNDFNMDHIFPKNHFKSKELLKRGIEKTSYYIDKNIYNGIVNLQMLDSNENKSKGEKSYEDWVKSSNVDLKKQLLPEIFGMNNFPKFVDKRYELLKLTLTKALTFHEKADT